MQDAPSVWPALAAFAAVIALIPIALWILKRLQSGSAGSTRSIAGMQNAAVFPEPVCD
jgi:flagellar biogenesis protein FliO